MILVYVVDIFRVGIIHVMTIHANNSYTEDVMEIQIVLRLEMNVKRDVLRRRPNQMKDRMNTIQTKVY
jgi:hypothetical protein